VLSGIEYLIKVITETRRAVWYRIPDKGNSRNTSCWLV